MKQIEETSIDWALCQKIADMPSVDAHLRAFQEDPSGDGGVMVVRSVLAAQTCEWAPNDGTWHSGCGKEWVFMDGGPKDNGMNFCHSCGGHLIVAEANEHEDGDGESPCAECHAYSCNGECTGHGAMGD